MTPEQERLSCERTFRRYGLPLLVHDHSSRRDVFGRAAPLLVVVLLFEVAAAARLAWPWWLNLLGTKGAEATAAEVSAVDGTDAYTPASDTSDPSEHER